MPQDGIEARMGAKKSERKNTKEVMMAVMPVRLEKRNSVSTKLVPRFGICSPSLSDTTGGLDKDGRGRHAQQGAHRDAERVNQESHRGAFKVARPVVHQVGMTRHTERRAGKVENVNVEERDEGEPDVSIAVIEIDILGRNKLKAVPRCDLLEEIPIGIASLGVREERDGVATARPAADGDEEDRPEERALDAVNKQERSEDPTEEDTDPDARVLQDVRFA